MYIWYHTYKEIITSSNNNKFYNVNNMSRTNNKTSIIKVILLAGLLNYHKVVMIAVL